MQPKVSFLIPTLNSQTVLENCLKSISEQIYDKESIEIIIADGGSTDATLEIAKKYGAKVVSNPLKTAESGKMVALKHATGEFVALTDSDNFLPSKTWLEDMIEPLTQEYSAVGSEPWEYTWRKEDGFISRYCALIGMNDPIVIFSGNYDRINLLTGKWTETPHDEKDKGAYILATFDKRGIPTIGANGTVFRREFLANHAVGDYLFDIDILANYLKKAEKVDFIKVKQGIIHSFCEGDIAKFARKQRRRVMDYLYHKSKKDRNFEWETGSGYKAVVLLIIYCITVVPLFAQSIYGFSKKQDFAWFFHPLASWITLWEYGWGTIKSVFVKSEANRDNWKQ